MFKLTRGLSLAACLASVLSACNQPIPAPKAVADEPLGGPCLADADCASGLSCLTFQFDPGGASWEGGNVCTIGCGSDAGACPAGTSCVTNSSPASGSGSVVPMCIPTCTSQSDCLIGGRQMFCLTSSDAGFCEQFLCGEGGDTTCNAASKPATLNCTNDCPSGQSCVGHSGGYLFCQQ